MSPYLYGLTQALTPLNLLAALLSTAVGIMIGALPGLSAALGVALLIPLTYGMPAATGLIVLVGIYCGAIFGGSISAILISTPGTPAAAATVIDGYKLTKKGKGGKALATAAVASFAGAITSSVALYLFSPPLARLALRFGPSEYFWLAIFGLTVIAGVSSKSLLKGLLSGAFGLTLAAIGMDPIYGGTRFTMGMPGLYGGLAFTPTLIGLFSMSQVMIMAEAYIGRSGTIENVKDKVSLTWAELKGLSKTITVGSILGTVIGILPGAGATIASFVSYNEARRFSKNKAEFGEGSLEGVAAAEAANNATTGGALIPTLTLGIPGSSVAAVLLGGLLIQGLRPGPDLFLTHAKTTYTVFAGFITVNFFMLILGLLAAPLFAKVTRVSDKVLIPTVFAFSTIGAYAINNSLFDVKLMFVFGIIGYFIKKCDLNPAAIILALILGPLAESGIRRTLLISDGSYAPLFASPISMILIALSLASLVSPFIMEGWGKKKKLGEAQVDE